MGETTLGCARPGRRHATETRRGRERRVRALWGGLRTTHGASAGFSEEIGEKVSGKEAGKSTEALGSSRTSRSIVERERGVIAL